MTFIAAADTIGLAGRTASARKSVLSAHDIWAYARAWLSRRLRPE
jgi:hypothetical protein